MGQRGDATRELILDAAERLYGSLGVANVSLRQIRIAAGQGNEAAIQYHFGDRDGVIGAVAERHLPRLRDLVVETMRHEGPRRSQRSLVAVLVRPWADYIELGQSARDFVRIVADLIRDPTMGFLTMQANTLPEWENAGVQLFERLSRRLSSELAVERVWTISRLAIFIVAERALQMDEPKPARPLLPADAFAENLVAMANGALSAPAQL
jgi:AcrR family transcriptional regulator